MSKLAVVGPESSNGAEAAIVASMPYVVNVTLVGTADLLFHRWNDEAVAEKGKAAKGSKAKKIDNLESYVYRNDENMICLPGEYCRMAIVGAAKFRQDPRSSRKSAMDLYKAGVVSLTPLASMGRDVWDYEHHCRVTIQRNGITRVRPAFKVGWEVTMQFQVLLPEYILPSDLHDVLANAGKLIGLADFRPTYGRFQIRHFEVEQG